MRPKATTPSIDPCPSLSVAELAWAAGFFEGEGSVRINSATRRNHTALMALVPNTDESLVRFFLERWGGSIQGRAAQGRRRRFWRWTCSSRMAARFFRDILPYVVSPRIRAKIELALEFQLQKSRPGRQPEGDRAEYFGRQLEYFERMKVLNLRGPEGADGAMPKL